MPEGLDHISQLIGQLQSSVEHIRRTTEAIDKKVDSTNTLCTIANQSAKSAHSRIAELSGTVDDHEEFKNKSLGIVAVISFLVALLGTGIGKVIGSIF